MQISERGKVVMPEQFNFVIFLPRSATFPSRSSVVELIFSISSSWLNEPKEYMLLDWRTGIEKSGPWSEGGRNIPENLGRTELLCVYETISGQTKFADCVSVEEGDINAAYTISVRRSKITRESLPAINDWILSLVARLSDFSTPLLAGGSEFELQGDVDLTKTDDFIKFALNRFSNCIWVVSPSSLVPSNFEKFNTIGLSNDYVLLVDKNLPVIFQ